MEALAHNECGPTASGIKGGQPHMLARRVSAVFALAIVATVLVPIAALAQTDVAALPDNSSPVIGALVAWLLAAGGIISVVVAMGVDRRLRSGR